MRIDRPAEDDTPRASPESPAADTPSVAEHETPDRVACALKYRETVDAAYREYQGAREWDEAVPVLREAWENHEKRWTHPERTGPTVHPEVPGAWRGDGGRYLAPDANAEVAHGCARIREVGETVITPAMRRIEAEDPDRTLVGLENRLKGKDRLSEKVEKWLSAQPDLRPDDAFKLVKDAIRYTFVYSEEHYTEGVYADCDRLESAGFEPVDRQNSWKEDQYKGINGRWREPGSGMLFEVQFHTRESVDAKELTHSAYERIRDPATSPNAVRELRAFQSEVCSRIKIPPRATEIPDNNYVQEG